MDAKPVYSNLYNTKVREEKITNTELYGNLLKVLEHTFTVKPVVRLRATLQYSHAMLVFWLAVCSEQVASSNFNLLPRGTSFPRKLRGESRSCPLQ